MGDSQDRGQDEPQASGRRDFFVSYTGADLPWAQWITWELEDAGFTTVLQEWDFQAGANFVLEMHRAAAQTHRTIAVLSPRYLDAQYTQPEWAAALVGDASSAERRLVPVRVEDCQPEGLLRGIVYIDLVRLGETEARQRLRERIAATLGGRSKPATAPAWPAPAAATPAAPAAARQPRFATVLPDIWNLPFRRNPTFIGREAELAALDRQLGQIRTAAVTQAIQGGGGVGKTTLAAEYAWRHRAEFEVVWWLRAEQPASLVGDYAELATALGLPEATLAEQQAAVRAVRRWLEGHDRWLLVLDNAEDPQTATGLRPPLARLVDLLPQAVAEHGQVLVTTRDAGWEQETTLVDLDLLTPQEAVRFLLARTGSSDQSAAAQVAAVLGYLPLALEQAGAYVAETRIGLAAYLERLRRSLTVALARGRPRDRDPADTVASTWRVSLERVRQVAGARALLEVCAFLAPEDIPRELFAQPLEASDDPLELRELAPLAADPFVLDEAVASLRRYGLVKADEQALSMHRLLQQVIRDRLDAEMASNRVELAVRLLVAAFPRSNIREPRLWPAQARLLPHILAAADHAEQGVVDPDALASLLSIAGGYLLDRSRYKEAKRLYEQALALTESTHGTDHPETAGALHNLGWCLAQAGGGDVALARQYLERALVIDEATWGPVHPRVATDLLHLGQVQHNLGKLALARQQLERAVAIAEATWGPDDPKTAIPLSCLGRVFYDLGDLAASRQRFERALAVHEAALGLDHLYVADALRDLGRVLRTMGDLKGLADVRQRLERALAIAEPARDTNDPTVATILGHLGRMSYDLGDLADARRYLERALAIFEATQGSDHISVGFYLANLGRVLRALGDLAGARKHLERSLAIQQATWHSDHPEMAYCLTDLSGLLRDLGDLAGARRYLERALAIKQASLGPEHPDTKATVRALTDLDS